MKTKEGIQRELGLYTQQEIAILSELSTLDIKADQLQKELSQVQTSKAVLQWVLGEE